MRKYPQQIRVVGGAPTFAALPSAVANAAILQFFIRLPYHLPVRDGINFRMTRSAEPNQPPWVTIYVRQFDISLAESVTRPYQAGYEVLRGEILPEGSAAKSTQTWVIAETLDVRFEDEPEVRKRDEFLTLIFERCLAAINILSESSRLTTGEVWSRPLAKDSLDPEVVYLLLDPRNGRVLAENNFRLNRRKINPVVISRDERKASEMICKSVARRLESDAAATPHPFITARSLALEAENQRLHGASSASVVSLQASMETLLRGLCKMLHRDLKTSPAVIAEKAEVPFSSLLKKELPALLGGRWSGPQVIPVEYEEKLYKLRNRIVHAGYTPSYAEVNPAFNSAHSFKDFIEDRLKGQWRKYPKTVLAWHDGLAGGPERIPKSAKVELNRLRNGPDLYWAD